MRLSPNSTYSFLPHSSPRCAQVIFYSKFLFSSTVVALQSLSCVLLFVTSWTAALQAALFFTLSWSLLKFMFIKSVMLSISSTVAPFSSCPQFFPKVFPVKNLSHFSSELALCIQWPKKCSFSVSPLNDYLGLISFRIDWLDSFVL